MNPAAQGGGDEEEGETCSICFEPWTTAGNHRLAALRCGHLFGHECIKRWLVEGNKCPQVGFVLRHYVCLVRLMLFRYDLRSISDEFLKVTQTADLTFFLQCNKKAKRDHIIFLYARRLKALDNTESVQLKKYEL